MVESRILSGAEPMAEKNYVPRTRIAARPGAAGTLPRENDESVRLDYFYCKTVYWHSTNDHEAGVTRRV
jgi:hypothetical protein